MNGLAMKQAADAGPVLTLTQGLLRGMRADGIDAYKGIPFAAPPIGPRRFLPPQPPPGWAGVRDASRFASAPMQPAPPQGLTNELFLGAETSEDCLYLNVWVPTSPGPHPVFAWIHGGGNTMGAASQTRDGAAFAQAGIVCVSIGYRLGAFGFLDLGNLLGPRYRGSGVNALRDLVAALGWVRDNIAAFGGDPGRVTVGGVSAGAKNILCLMASPMARGLFTAAIVQSGGQTIHDGRSVEQVTGLFADHIRKDGGDPRWIARMPAADLMALQDKVTTDYGRPYPFRAVIGTDMLPHAPLAALATAGTGVRRLLIGTNRDEAIISLDRGTAALALTQDQLSNIEVDRARRLAARYDRHFASRNALYRRVRFLSAEEYEIASLRMANACRTHSPVWAYRFEQAAASGPFVGWAPHASEVPYVWQTLDTPGIRAFFGPSPTEGPTLSADMNRRWCQFIKGDRPDGDGSSPWPMFDGTNLLVFGEGRAMAGEVDRAEYALWDNEDFGPPRP